MSEDDSNKRAYNALLTLLKDDVSNTPKRAKTSKRSKQSDGPAPSTEETVEAVEGLDSSTGSEDQENVDQDEEDDENLEIQVEDDNEGDLKDPFETHFAAPPQFEVPEKWELKPVKTLPLLGERSFVQVAKDQSSLFINDEFKYTPVSMKTAFAKVKHRLQAPFTRANHSDPQDQLSQLQSQLAKPLFNYQDVFFTQRTWQNFDECMDLVTLHMVNHVYKTRDRVLKNNSKLREIQLRESELKRKLKERRYEVSIDDDEEKQDKENDVKATTNDTAEEEEGSDDDNEDDDAFRDQGFTRPKVLVVLPTRQAAYEFFNRLMKVSGLSQSENRKRFKEAFNAEGADMANKPEDFQKLFAGNSNEVFCLGIKFTRQALKLYSPFYASDLILASPLGLRLVVDKKDYDFLSSIEICMCDQLDAIQMQSWTNIKHIFDKLNEIPKDPHDCDFSRVREWYLDQKAKYLRQTILLSAYATPEMVSLFNKLCLNVAGKFRSRFEYKGIISSLRIHVRQTFTRVNVSSFLQDSKQRLDHFSNGLLPSLLRGAQTEGILIVAPTYTDFVMLRNFLEKNDHSYVSISEYTPPSQLGRGRTFFADGRAKMMLYSARLHHYRRYGIKGARTIVFYGLPDNPVFYQEFVRNLARTVIEQRVDPDLLRVHILFSKWDALKLERVVGTQRVGQLIEGNNDVHELY